MRAAKNRDVLGCDESRSELARRADILDEYRLFPAAGRLEDLDLESEKSALSEVRGGEDERAA